MVQSGIIDLRRVSIKEAIFFFAKMSSNSSDQSVMESQPHTTVLTSAQGIAPASRKPSVPSSITSTSTSTGKPVSPIFGSNHHTPVSIASLQATYNPPNVNKSLGNYQ